ncbi:hypothetical protein ABE078_18235 [Priestia megaterium]|jgi:nitric oxide dioxygenase
MLINFILHDHREQPAILISEGIGIILLLSMLNTIVEEQSERHITFIHVTIDGKTHAFKEHVAQLDRSNENVTSFICYSSPNEEDRLGDDFDKEGYVDSECCNRLFLRKKLFFTSVVLLLLWRLVILKALQR